MLKFGFSLGVAFNLRFRAEFDRLAPIVIPRSHSLTYVNIQDARTRNRGPIEFVPAIRKSSADIFHRNAHKSGRLAAEVTETTAQIGS